MTPRRHGHKHAEEAVGEATIHHQGHNKQEIKPLHAVQNFNCTRDYGVEFSKEFSKELAKRMTGRHADMLLILAVGSDKGTEVVGLNVVYRTTSDTLQT